MVKVNYIVAVVLGVVLISGCETLKSTISGPFIGMEKDVQNVAKVSGKVLNSALNDSDDEKSQGALRRIDNWMQKNWW